MTDARKESRTIPEEPDGAAREGTLESLRRDIDFYIATHFGTEPWTQDGYDACNVARFSRAARAFSDEDRPVLDERLRQRGETFSRMLLRLIDERNLRDSEVYRNANIDRRLFSKIRGDEDYIPSKKTAICFCMALQLDLEEAGQLLEAAGYALSTSSRADLIIMYLLENREYSVVLANILLESYGESALTR